MSWRKIVVEGEVYNWKCSGSTVSIRNNRTGKGANIAITELKPMSPEGGVTPRDIRNYIDANLRREVLGIDVIQLLKEYYHGAREGSYSGSTLTILHNEKPLIFNVGKGQSDEENCWIALNYIKQFGPNAAHSNEAVKLLRTTAGFKKAVTQAMLRSF